MKLVALILLVVMSGLVYAGEQPFPRMGETAQEFVDRYGAWVESIPSEDCAWDEMQAVDEKVREVFEWSRDMSTDPTDERWERTAEFVRSNPEIMVSIRQYSVRAHLGVPKGKLLDWTEEDPDYEPVPIDIMLPHLSSVWLHARLLAVEATIAAQNGDHERAIESLEVIRELQRFIPVTNSVIECLVEIAFATSAAEVLLGNWLDLTGLNQEHLERLKSMLIDTPFEMNTWESLNHEQWVLDSVLRYYFEDAQDGRISLKGVKRFLKIVRLIEGRDDEPSLVGAIMFQQRIAPYPEQVELATKIWTTREADFQEEPYLVKSFQGKSLLDQFNTGNVMEDVKYAPAIILELSYRKFYNRRVLRTANLNTMSLLIALHIQRLHSGSFPESYDQLDMTLLSEHPIDPMTGELLHFTIKDDTVSIYSNGLDRDDDGGISMLNDSGEPEFYPDFLTLDELEEINSTDPKSIDGDWILYPLVSE